MCLNMQGDKVEFVQRLCSGWRPREISLIPERIIISIRPSYGVTYKDGDFVLAAGFIGHAAYNSWLQFTINSASHIRQSTIRVLSLVCCSFTSPLIPASNGGRSSLVCSWTISNPPPHGVDFFKSVTLRLAVSQSVCLDAKPLMVLMTRCLLLLTISAVSLCLRPLERLYRTGFGVNHALHKHFSEPLCLCTLSIDRNSKYFLTFLIFRIPVDGKSPQTQWLWVMYTTVRTL
jgi:hypothetical protein